MSVAKVIEITATSSRSFQDAIEAGIARASKTVEEIQPGLETFQVDCAASHWRFRS